MIHSNGTHWEEWIIPSNPETNSKFAPENGKLEDDIFWGGDPYMETLFSGA